MANLPSLRVAPFVLQPQGTPVNIDLATSSPICFGGCCVLCPYQSIPSPFDDANRRNPVSLLHWDFQAANRNVISAILCLVLLITYLVLPHLVTRKLPESMSSSMAVYAQRSWNFRSQPVLVEFNTL